MPARSPAAVVGRGPHGLINRSSFASRSQAGRLSSGRTDRTILVSSWDRRRRPVDPVAREAAARGTRCRDRARTRGLHFRRAFYQATHQVESDSQAALGTAHAVLHLAVETEFVGKHAAMPSPVSHFPAGGLAAVGFRPDDVPAFVPGLGAVVQRLDRTWASRVRSPSANARSSGSETSRRCFRASIKGRLIDGEATTVSGRRAASWAESCHG